MLVPQPGWAEHRADEDWWGDLVVITRELLATSGVDPRSIGAVATSAIGPCMLPVDAAGAPLMNGVLYGVDTRASGPDRGAHRQARRGRDPRGVWQRAHVAVGGTQDPVAQGDPSRPVRPHGQGPDLHQLPGLEADRRVRHRPLHGRELLAAVRREPAGLDRGPRARHPAARPTAPAGLVHGYRGHGHGGRRGRDGPRRGHARHRGHDRRSRRGGERRRAGPRRDDAHVRLDGVHHPGHWPAAARPPALVRAVDGSRAACLDGRAGDLGHVDQVVPRRAGPGRDLGRAGRGPRRRAPRVPRASCACPTSPASGRPSTIPTPRGRSSGWT